MYGDNITTAIGNMASDPELRFGTNGVAVCSFTIFLNEPAKEGREQRSHAMRVSAFGSLAENIVESCSKGSRVIVVGRYEQYPMKGIFDEKGEPLKREGTSFVAESVGVEIRWASAKITKNSGKPKAKAASDGEDAFAS